MEVFFHFPGDLIISVLRLFLPGNVLPHSWALFSEEHQPERHHRAFDQTQRERKHASLERVNIQIKWGRIYAFLAYFNKSCVVPTVLCLMWNQLIS